MEQFVVFCVDELRLGLAAAAVERVIRAVYITRLPNAPDIVLGVINLRGQILPVVDMRRRFGLVKRDIGLADRLIIARTVRRQIAFVADSVTGIVEYPAAGLVEAAGMLPRLEQITGVVKLDDGLIFIHDLDRFLSLDEEDGLERALAARGEP